MPFLQPNVTYTGNAQALFVPMGSGGVVPTEVTFAAGITVDAPGVYVNNAPIASDGIANGVSTAVGSSRVQMIVNADAETEVIERVGVGFTTFVDQEGVPAFRISVGGQGATGVDKENVLGLYISDQAEPPVETAVFEVGATGAMDIKVPLTIDGEPVPHTRAVPYVGLTGSPATNIDIPANSISTPICANFAVKAGHTYRASIQGFWQSADTNPASITALYVVTTDPASVTQVGIGGVKNAQADSAFGQTYTATFVPLIDSEECKIVGFNSSSTDVCTFVINTAVPANAPAVVVEDLGVLPVA